MILRGGDCKKFPGSMSWAIKADDSSVSNANWNCFDASWVAVKTVKTFFKRYDETEIPLLTK